MTDYAHRILECIERLELGEETPEDREQIAAFVRRLTYYQAYMVQAHSAITALENEGRQILEGVINV